MLIFVQIVVVENIDIEYFMYNMGPFKVMMHLIRRLLGMIGIHSVDRIKIRITNENHVFCTYSFLTQLFYLKNNKT